MHYTNMTLPGGNFLFQNNWWTWNLALDYSVIQQHV